MSERKPNQIHRAVVTFERPVTDEDLKSLQSTADVLEVLEVGSEDVHHHHHHQE